MTAGFPLSRACGLTVASLVVAALGVVIQIISGADYPPVPPVFFIILVPAALIGFGRWRWTPLTAVLAGVFLTFGLLASGESGRLFNPDSMGDSVGLWMQTLAMVAAAVVGVVAAIQNYGSQTPLPNAQPK